MNIRTGDASEVQDFALFDEENEGEITVLEVDGEVVAFAQHNGTTVYMIECAVEGKGYARTLIESILNGADYAAADNVVKASEGFWTRMGFQYESRNHYGQPVWVWYPAE